MDKYSERTFTLTRLVETAHTYICSYQKDPRLKKKDIFNSILDCVRGLFGVRCFVNEAVSWRVHKETFIER